MMRSGNMHRITTGAAAALGLCAALAGPASAAPEPGPTPGGAVAGKTEHCVVHLEDHGKRTCHAGFREAVEDATGGRVTDAPDDPGKAMADPNVLDQIGAGGPRLGPIVLSIEFEHIRFGGSSISFTGTHECQSGTANPEFSYEDLNRVGWNDRISSYRLFANCLANHYENPAWNGVQTGYQATTEYIGDLMNDRTSSLRWS